MLHSNIYLIGGKTSNLRKEELYSKAAITEQRQEPRYFQLKELNGQIKKKGILKTVPKCTMKETCFLLACAMITYSRPEQNKGLNFHFMEHFN